MKNKPFIVVTLGSFVMGDGIKSALESFRLFRNGLTRKHYNKIQLVIVEKTTYIEDVQKAVALYDLVNNVKIIDLDEQENVTKLYKNGSIIFLPTQNKINKIIPEALSFGLPILTYKEHNDMKIIDNTCGMLVDSWNIGNSVIQFATVLNDLYFDPNVTEILKRGALAKYNKEFKFSRRR